MLFAFASRYIIRYPALVGSGLTVGGRYFFADSTMQTTEYACLEDEDKRDGWNFDMKRLAIMTVFGFLYGAGPGHLAYVKLYPRLFPKRPLAAAFFDVTVQCNLVYFPMFYLVSQLIGSSETLPAVKDRIKKTLPAVKDRINSRLPTLPHLPLVHTVSAAGASSYSTTAPIAEPIQRNTVFIHGLPMYDDPSSMSISPPLPEQGKLEFPTTIVKRALATQRENFVGDNSAAAGFWLPIHYLNFKFVPLHYRMAFMSVTGVGWSAIMSVKRGSDYKKTVNEFK